MAPSVQDIEKFLARSDRFFCLKLEANISFRDCVDRQTRAEKTHKTRGKKVPYISSSHLNQYCRSGECTLGKQNLVKLKRMK